MSLFNKPLLYILTVWMFLEFFKISKELEFQSWSWITKFSSDFEYFDNNN